MKTLYYLKSIMWLFFINITAMAYSNTTVPTVQELISQSQSYYEQSDTFQLALTYTLSRFVEQPRVIEQYEGMIIRKEDNMYMKIQNTEIVLTSDDFIKVNHQQKAMEYSNTMPDSSIQNPIVLDQYLSLFSKKEVLDEGVYWKCVLTAPTLTQLPYGAITIYFDKKTGGIHKQVMELVQPGAFANELGELSNDRKFLTIDFQKMTFNPRNVEKFLKIQTYVSKNKDVIKPAERFVSYKLMNRSTK